MISRFNVTFMLGATMLSCCGPAYAQPAATPPAAPPAAGVPPAAPTAAAEAPAPSIETDPAILAALEHPRETPADYFQSIIWLIELGRPELAKPILDELAKLPLTDAQRADLVTRFGSRDMLMVAQAKELAPAGAQFTSACMNAAASVIKDPKRIATLVAQLAGPTTEGRLIARNDLAAIGQTGINATLEALAKETDPAQRAAIASAARQMNPLVVGPLLAMLDTADPELRATVSTLLESLSVRQAVPLLPQAPGTAEQALTEALTSYRRGMLPFAPDASGQIELWHWDDAAKRLTSKRYPAEEARIIWMARLARELARYSPEDSHRTRQARLLELEAAALAGMADSSALAELQSDQLSDLNQLLADALKLNYTHAAVAAADALGNRGFDSVLYSYEFDTQAAPLARALRHPNRPVRFAALRAIMQLDPKAPYPFSSYVPDALAWFAAGAGERRAVVALQTTAAATNLAGMLNAEGLQGAATSSGREAVDMALAMPDLEMIFLDVNINGPAIRQVVYELRINPTTAEVPIAILAPNARLAAAGQIASEHQRVIAVPRIHSSAVLHRTIDRLTALSGRFATPPNARAAQAVEALTWLSKLASGERPFYKVRRSEPVIEAALYRANSANPAIDTLGKLGTAESQTALVNFASQPALPIQSRVQSADAFGNSVAAQGVLLTTDQILTQYDRYNASETADADTQHVLGSLLDTIESRRAATPQFPAFGPPPPAPPQQ